MKKHVLEYEIDVADVHTEKASNAIQVISRWCELSNSLPDYSVHQATVQSWFWIDTMQKWELKDDANGYQHGPIH